MAVIKVMPKLGLTMQEGTIDKWVKKEGDEVKIGEVFLEVSTDKLTNEIEAKENGIIRKLLASEGDVIKCLEPIAIIADKDEDISEVLAKVGVKEVSNNEDKSQIEEVVKEKKEKKTRVKASPIAKKLAEENGIDISEVVGSGPKNRITKEDVEKYIEMSKNKGPKTSPLAKKVAEKLDVSLDEINKEGRIMKKDVEKFNENRSFMFVANPTEERIPMTKMRKVISKRMSESWNVSPAVTFDIKVDVSNLRDLKNELKDVKKLTYTDFLVKIVAKTLIEFPLLNSSVDGNEIITRNYANIGVAVAIENGLVVPVVKYSNVKGLEDISKEIKELAYKAKTNQLGADDLTGGTFTITNLGMFGIDAFSPIINQPQVAILGVNTITETLVLENDKVVSKPFMKLSLTADHRAVDGSVAAQFLYKLKQYIEKPSVLVL